MTAAYTAVGTNTGNKFPDFISEVCFLIMNTKYTAANADKNEYFAVAYYRLSKDDKAKSESDSIANQRKLISSYVDSHSNIKLVEEHYDDGYTGTNFDEVR